MKRTAAAVAPVRVVHAAAAVNPVLVGASEMKFTRGQIKGIIREALDEAAVPSPSQVEAIVDEIGDRAAGGYEPIMDGSPEAYADAIIDSYLNNPPAPVDEIEGLEHVLTNHRDDVEAAILDYIGMMTEEKKMKITKRQLRKIIREAMDPPDLEDAPEEYQRGYQDALDGAPKDTSGNDEYDAGYEDGEHDAELGVDLGPGPGGYRLDKQRSGRRN